MTRVLKTVLLLAIAILLLSLVIVIPHMSGTADASSTQQWSKMSSPTTTQHLISIWGTAIYDIFAVGGGGTILHYDGVTWSKMQSNTNVLLYDIWGSSSNNVFAVGDYQILHYNGANWAVMKTFSYNIALYSVWGMRGVVFASGRDMSTNEGVIYLYEGTPPSWKEVYRSNRVRAYKGISGQPVGSGSAVRAFFAGHLGDSTGGEVLSYTYGYVNPVKVEKSLGSGLNGIWAAQPEWIGGGPLDIFAVGSLGVILHYDGSTWTTMSTGATYLSGVWGSSVNDMYAAGSDGAIFHYGGTGTQWTRVPSGTTVALFDVWGCPSGIFAVGQGGTILMHSNEMPVKPINTSPADGASARLSLPILQSSPFSDPDGDDTHGSSQWQVTDTPGDYSSPVFQSGRDTINKTSIMVQSSLNLHTTYYWRVRYFDNHGRWSSWSDETSFVTNNNPLTPTNYSPASGATGVSLTPTLQSSAFLDPDGDTHTASEWQVTDTPGDYSSPVFQSGRDTANKTAILVSSGLAGQTAYYWRVRHQDNYGGWSSWSGETSFTTLIPAPTIASLNPVSAPPGNTISVTIVGSDLTGATAVNFGTGININSFTVDNTTQITANISIADDAAPGTRDVSVTTPAGTGTLVDGFIVEKVLTPPVEAPTPTPSPIATPTPTPSLTPTPTPTATPTPTPTPTPTQTSAQMPATTPTPTPTPTAAASGGSSCARSGGAQASGLGDLAVFLGVVSACFGLKHFRRR